MLAQFGYIAPAAKAWKRPARPRANRCEINPRLAEGHVALAAVIEAYDWDWAGAEREYRRALQLSPGLQSAHLWYGMFLRDQGRLKEAMPELRRAAQLAPYSVMACVNLAYGLLAEGNYAAALEQARRAVELAPELASASWLLLRAARAAGADEGCGRGSGPRSVRSASGDPHAMSLVACELARLGRREESLKLVAELESLSQQRYVSPFDLGKVSLALGDGDRALNLFEEAYRQRSSGMIFLRNANATCVRDTRASTRCSTRCTSRAETRYSRGVDPSNEFGTAEAAAARVGGGGVAQPGGDAPPLPGIHRSLATAAPPCR